MVKIMTTIISKALVIVVDLIFVISHPSVMVTIKSTFSD